MLPLLPALLSLMLLAGCLFDDGGKRHSIDTRNDHDSSLVGKWISTWRPEGQERRESFDGSVKRSEDCNSSGCSRTIAPYRTIHDTLYHDSVTFTSCDLSWGNCKTTVFVPIEGTQYGYYGGGDTLWLGGTALTYVRE